MNLPLLVAGLVLLISVGALPITARYIPTPRRRAHAKGTRK
ncbi:hypothetical protein [Streptomyces sp. MI02-7b]|nr:hypothetical protein [Streptomyces sp. MI02-7b]MDX3074589.1 hypothetical protein [Streptomyces sp. MI02-7b]